ncbi:MAG: ComEC/Rec2 family competence protein [Planctomycetota bacterium]
MEPPINPALPADAAAPSVQARTARARAVAAFIAFAAGTLALIKLPAAAGLGPGTLFAAACTTAAVGLILRQKPSAIALLIAITLLGGANAAWRINHRSPDSVAAQLELAQTSPHTAVFVEIEGIVTRPPERSRPTRGSLSTVLPDFFLRGDRFGYDLAVRLAHTRGGPQPASGVARVSVEPGPGAGPPAVNAGDRVRVRGFARPVTAPSNPGQRDFRSAARERGDRFWLDTGNGATTAVIDHPTAGSRARGLVAAALAWPRQRASAAIDRATDDDDAGELVRGLILGERDYGAPGLGSAFQRIGLAHLLSVSGFHVAVMAFIALLFIRATGDRGPLEPLIVAAAIAVYMLVVPVRAPILRAGFTVLVLLIFDAMGRRHDRLALLAWIAVAVVALRPTDLLTIGFQLSFGLVAWLLIIAEPRPDRLTLRATEDSATVALWRLPLRWLRTAAFAAAACWSVSIPLIIYHTGAVAPLAVVATVLTVPLIVLTMWLGVAVLIAAAAAGPLADALAPVLALPAGACAALVRAIDSLPLATIRLPEVSLAWTIAATAAAAYAWRRGRLRSLPMWAVLLGSAAWLAVEARTAAPLDADTELRVTMLDVGNGTCIVLERGRDALLWDAGAFGESVGVRTIPDAARAIGAPRIRAAVITHANLDHFMGLLDLARPLGLETVITGESFARAADRDPAGPAALTLARLGRAGVEHRIVAAGDTIALADAELRVLHPPAGFVPRAENDASLVAVLEPIAGGPRLLLTGDIQDEAIARLLESGIDLTADILELPHHGSARESAAELVRRVDPRVVLQSTGPSRLADPRWDPLRAGRTWLVTARDGAVRAEIARDSTITAGPIR